ncbi:MAG TPA: hypothetical protein VHA78_00285 [Candidatus Peribacteraceae bacterium]|nr:hypothetical protein [Candidatus Peribacteraceae bacterium]
MRRQLRFSADVLTGFLIFLLFSAVILLLRNPTSLDDGLRHFAMAQQLRGHGIGSVSGWNVFLYEGYLSRVIVDPWFLSDVLMIPFTYLPPIAGLHLFVVATLFGLVAVSILLFRSLQLKPGASAFFLALLLFGDQQFMGRFLFARPYSLITIALLCVVWAIIRRNWIAVMIVACVSVLLSQLFVFPLLVCFVAAAALFLSSRKRDAGLLLLAAGTGAGMGIFLHPDAAAYVTYLVDAFLHIPFLRSIGLSGEMSSGLSNLSFISVLCAWTLVILLLTNARRSGKLRFFGAEQADVLWLCALCLLLTAGYLFWLRTIDVLWPLLVVCLARLYVLDTAFVWSLPHLLLPSNAKMRLTLLLAGGILCSGQMIATPYTFLRDDTLHSLSDYVSIRAVPTGSRVLNLDWDRFFMFVFLRPDLHYATGIDPTFTYLTDPASWRMILRMTAGQALYSLAMLDDTVRQLLIAYPSDDVALSKQRFSRTIAALKQDAEFRLLSDSGSIAVFAVPDRYR